ncbi:hypothetical protein, conserved [Leishmania tarentolae]|uniref:Uncharacterized protein n=1 Tax=Leishmania tarentolae TaxID=5689 RepID=A0A640KVM6_LEITA|nr:hypothetical protein, conserved [Leishmania tarentolae]
MIKMVGGTVGGISGGSARQPPTRISRRTTQSALVERTLSSPVLSSDTASTSHGLPRMESIAPAEMSVPSLLWEDQSASHSAQYHGEGQSIVTGSSEWRTSLDFAQQLDIKAEKELDALWSSLWIATHSKAALQTALESRRASWNPYRPVRGGPEVKAEILHSEVAEFQAMVPTDSLYLRGVAVQPPASSPPLSASLWDSTSRVSNSWVSPVFPHGTGGQACATKDKRKTEDEVLVMDGPYAVDVWPQSVTLTSPTRGSSWWAVRRSESEAVLFRYMWEAVVVPYYASMPSAFFSAALLGDGEVVHDSGSLMPFVPDFEEREDKDASTVFTAFGITREGVRKWSLGAYRRSSSPSSTSVSPVKKPDPSNVGGAQFSMLKTVRAHHPGSGGGSHLMASRDLDIVSDDSLEVEVLEENKDSIHVPPKHTTSPVAKEGDQSGEPPGLATAPTKRRGQRRQRPSTACVHVLATTPLDVVETHKPSQRSTHASNSTMQQRTPSVCSDNVPIAGASSPPHRDAAASSSMRGGPLGTTLSQREAPFFHTTAKASEKAPKTSSPSPPRVAVKPRHSRAQPQAAEGPRTASPAVIVAAENNHKPPQRVHPGSEASRARGGHTTTSTGRGKVSPATRSASGTASSARISHADHRTVSPPASANASAQHVLQLLDLHSRPTARATALQRNLLPISRGATETEKRKSTKAELSPPEGPAPHAERCAFVSPMQSPCDGKRRRHAEQPKKSVEREMDASVSFDFPERILPNPQLGPLREVAVHSASTVRHPPAAPNSRGVANATASPGGRNASSRARQPGKAPQRLSSKGTAASTAQKRPTTAYH